MLRSYAARAISDIFGACSQKYNLAAIRLKEVYCRKDLQLIKYAVSPYQWELEYWQRTGARNLMDPYAQHLDSLFSEWCVPKLESGFGAAIRNFYLTERTIDHCGKYGYIIVRYHASIFETAASCTKPEDGLAHQAARAMRRLHGKGPGAIRAAIFENRAKLYLFSRLLSESEKNFLQLSDAHARAIADLNSFILKQAILAAHVDDYSSDSQVYSQIDPREDQGFVLFIP